MPRRPFALICGTNGSILIFSMYFPWKNHYNRTHFLDLGAVFVIVEIHMTIVITGPSDSFAVLRLRLPAIRRPKSSHYNRRDHDHPPSRRRHCSFLWFIVQQLLHPVRCAHCLATLFEFMKTLCPLGIAFSGSGGNHNTSDLLLISSEETSGCPVICL